MSVVSRSLLGHHIDVSIFKLDDGSLSDGLSLQKPLVMNGRAEAVAQPQGDHFLPFLVPVEHDSALLVVVVVVSFCYELVCIFQEHSEAFAGKTEDGHFAPGNDPSSSLLVNGLLRLISEAKVVPRPFVHDFPVT